MTARVAVSKMHGAHNDFVLLDARKQPIEEPVASFARRICDRRTGIGADGLLLVGNATRGDLSMRVINADGSEAEMCGNGVRCVARYADERGEGGTLLVETLAGPIATRVVERGSVYRVRVDMGTPRLVRVAVPFADAAVVDTGNPHLVLFTRSIDDVDLPALGERMQRDPLFRSGVNVHAVVVEDSHTLRVRHYERGVGLTMACGTGAVAAAAAAIDRGKASSPVTVHVPGGELTIEWDGRGAAYMTGPAVHVFDTTVETRVAERA